MMSASVVPRSDTWMAVYRSCAALQPSMASGATSAIEHQLRSDHDPNASLTYIREARAIGGTARAGRGSVLSQKTPVVAGFSVRLVRDCGGVVTPATGGK